MTSIQDIYNLLGTAGFIFSAFLCLRTLFLSRTNFSMKITETLIVRDKVNLYIEFINHSSLPVAITAIYLIHNDKKILCRSVPQVITRDKLREGDYLQLYPIYSLGLPVNLQSFGATSGYVLFVTEEFVLPPDAKELTFQVCTNRRRSLQMTLSLDSARNLRKDSRL